MQLIQTKTGDGDRQVLLIDSDGRARKLADCVTVYELARQAIARGSSLRELAGELSAGNTPMSLEQALDDAQLLSPVDHPDPAHVYVTGTGLTHLGSAQGRDEMHRKQTQAENLTDSMKMFRMGLEGGKPPSGTPGVQPEWFYKGNGHALAHPGADLIMPSFALDGSEEPELAGVYLIDDEGRPRRLGFALGNEFSDHTTERQNYLYLAHSKLRAASFGPTLLLDPLTADIRGMSRIVRDGECLWEKPFLTGEANMSHTFENLEFHHFKYPLFCQPGDVHVHFFGTATLSYSDGVRTQPGDIFEIQAEPFALPLRNTLRRAEERKVKVLRL